MAEKPRPKFGEKGHEGESMGAYRKRIADWEKAKPGGSEVAPGYVPPKPEPKKPPVHKGPRKTGPAEGDKKKDKAGNEYIFKGGRWQLVNSVKASAQRSMLKGKGSARKA